jgi:hypothetical protein
LSIKFNAITEVNMILSVVKIFLNHSDVFCFKTAGYSRDFIVTRLTLNGKHRFFCDTLVTQDRVGLNVPLYMDLREICDKQQQQQQ